MSALPAPLHGSWYGQACQDLLDLSVESSEEGFEPPEPATFEHTRNMLRILSEEYDEPPDIQPMDDRSIAICLKIANRTAVFCSW